MCAKGKTPRSWPADKPEEAAGGQAAGLPSQQRLASGPPETPVAQPPEGAALGGVLERAEGQSQQLAELAAEAHAGAAESTERLRDEKARRPGSFYSDLIYALSGLRHLETQARLLWGDLLHHKVEMANKLGRDVGIQVAALDFLKNIVGQLDRVHFVDPEQFLETARLAITDGLTGLYNHRYFHERLRQALQDAKLKKAPLSLLMVDIDYFKVYNDLNGHIAGDVALREVAEIIRRSLGPEAVACRYGGEEFAVILCGMDKEKASILAEDMRKEVEATEFPNEAVLPEGTLSVSVGVAEYPLDAHEPTGLIQYADRALYVAKRSGRNRVCSVVGDRRVFERIAYESPLVWEPVAGGERHRALCVNISSGGIGLRGEELPEPGCIVKIALPGIEDDPLIGKCVWREPRGSFHSAGIRFVALDRRQERIIGDIMGL